MFWNKKTNKDEYILELQNALRQSVDNSFRILRNESIRNFDEFISYVEHLLDRKI